MFFRQCKDKLALDNYQIRSAQGIRRYWLIMSFAHYMCVVGTGEVCPFETGYHKISDIIQIENISPSIDVRGNAMILTPL